MKKTYAIITIIILFAITSVSSQSIDDTRSKQSGIRTGISYSELRESLVTREKHQGPGFNLGWFGEKSDGMTIRRLEISTETYILKTPMEADFSSFRFRFQLNYSTLFNLTRNNPAHAFYLGGQAGMDANILYFDNWDQNHYYWLTSYYLALTSRFTAFRIGKGSLQIEGSIPFISITSRPPAVFNHTQAGSDFLGVIEEIHQRPGFQLPHHHLSLSAGIKYGLPAKNRSRINLYWKTQYLVNNTSDSGKLSQINHTLGIEFLFKSH